VFGTPPAYVMFVGTGLDIYYADMGQDPIGTATTDTIHLHAERLANLPTHNWDLVVRPAMFDG
jgi:hypothetical protein